jgi:hypothetical protein
LPERLSGALEALRGRHGGWRLVESDGAGGAGGARGRRRARATAGAVLAVSLGVLLAAGALDVALRASIAGAVVAAFALVSWRSG